jgi:hypothetical protein
VVRKTLLERDSAQYRSFWAKLGRGEFDAGQYRRTAKGGREVCGGKLTAYTK